MPQTFSGSCTNAMVYHVIASDQSWHCRWILWLDRPKVNNMELKTIGHGWGLAVRWSNQAPEDSALQAMPHFSETGCRTFLVTKALRNLSRISCPGDFITTVKQINSHSDLISMSIFSVPSYLTIISSVCIILIWDPCICNLHNLWQTGSSYIRRKPDH